MGGSNKHLSDTILLNDCWMKECMELKTEEEECGECGHKPLKKVGDIKQTRLFLCPQCFTEKITYLPKKECIHEEYDTKNNCLSCGEPKN